MFARIVEGNQDGALVGMETVEQYAEKSAGLMIQYRGFLNHLKTLDVGNRYLEIGPGPGVLTTAVAREKPNVQITGIEMSSDMVSVAREYVKHAGVADRVRFLTGDAGDPDAYASLGRYDLIYSTFSLHHWENPKQVILNLISVLEDGGLVYIHDLRRVWWLYWVPNSGGFWRSIRAAYVSRELHEILRSLRIKQYEIRNVFPFMHSILIEK
jgi:predicted O-methyltransferase YrrM